MGYKRADDVLPENILENLQKYVSGETIYVPKKHKERNGVQARVRTKNCA